MEGISDIKIDGIDPNRPPSAKQARYIDLFFKLNHKAPSAWCGIFNDQMHRHPSKPKIDLTEGLYIETWVKSADQIAAHLEQLKAAIKATTTQYIQKIELSRKAAIAGERAAADDNSPQGKLNRIVDALNFDVEE